jgi:hypothetical protein
MLGVRGLTHTAAGTLAIDPPGGGLEWSTLFGGGGGEFPRGIAVDAAGDAWFMGDSHSDPPAFPAAGGPSLTPSAQLGQNVFVARLHGTPGNGGGGGGGTGTCTVSATCLAEVRASLTDPDAAPDAKSRKAGPRAPEAPHQGRQGRREAAAERPARDDSGGGRRGAGPTLKKHGKKSHSRLAFCGHVR